MSKRFLLWAGMAAVALSLTGAPVWSGTLTLNPFQDNSMYEELPSASNGAGAFLFGGNTTFLNARRALLQFDVSRIPSGMTVTSATLELKCNQSPLINTASQDFDVHRLTADWGEAGSDAGDPGGMGAPAADGDATWTERFFGQGMPWGAAGGDFVAGSSGSASVGVCTAVAPVSVVFSSDGVVADVQAWVDDASSNHGWILIGDEVESETARRFVSREHTDRSLIPVLTVEFGEGDPVPASSTVGMLLTIPLLAGASAFAMHRRARQS